MVTIQLSLLSLHTLLLYENLRAKPEDYHNSLNVQITNIEQL